MRVGGCGATVEVLGYTASTPQWSSTATAVITYEAYTGTYLNN